MKMMQHTLAVMVALAGSLGWQPLAQGADQKASAPPAAESVPAWRERLQEAAKDLNLTEDQKEKLRPIFQSLLEKGQALREDASLSPQERTEKLKALQEEFAPLFKKVLTAEQFEKWQSRQSQLFALRLQEAIKELNLTEDQKEKLKAIFQEPMEKVRALRGDTSLTWQQKLARFKAARQEVAPKVKTVLTAEQYEKYQKLADQVQEEIKQRFQQRPN